MYSFHKVAKVQKLSLHPNFLSKCWLVFGCCIMFVTILGDNPLICPHTTCGVSAEQTHTKIKKTVAVAKCSNG